MKGLAAVTVTPSILMRFLGLVDPATSLTRSALITCVTVPVSRVCPCASFAMAIVSGIRYQVYGSFRLHTELDHSKTVLVERGLHPVCRTSGVQVQRYTPPTLITDSGGVPRYRARSVLYRWG